MSTRRGTPLALIVFAVACTASPPDTEVRSAIDRTWTRFEQAWVAGNVRAADSAFFTQDAINVPNGERSARGRAAIDSSLAPFLALNKVLAFTRTVEDLQIFGDHAVELGVYAQRVQPRADSVATDRGHYLAVWRREQNGEWRCMRFLYNAPPSG